MKINPKSIRRADDVQVRACLSDDTVREYMEAMVRGDTMPPVQVISEGETLWLWDGFHRVEAALMLGHETIEANVVGGSRADARWMATGANRSHGLRRTNADKARAVRQALIVRPEASDKVIASHVGVDAKTVWAHRQKMLEEQAIPDPPTRASADGKQHPSRATRTAETIKAMFERRQRKEPCEHCDGKGYIVHLELGGAA